MSTLKRMFLPPTDIKRRCQTKSRRLTAQVSSFGHIVLPGGGRNYPEQYVDALLEATSGPITADTVRRFNGHEKARAAMMAAQTEFERRVEERSAMPPVADLLTLNDVAWLLGMTLSPIYRRCESGAITTVTHDGRAFVRPNQLLESCDWSLPKR